MNVLRMVSSGQISRQRRMRCEIVLGVRRTLHQLENARAGVLKRHVEVGQELALRHQRDDLVHVRIRVHVVQPHPDAEFGQRSRQIGHARLERTSAPEAGAVFDVHAVGARVLRDDEELLDSRLDQVLGFLHHLADGPAHEVAAHRRDDAEGASMVAPFGDLDVRVVSRRELDALRRNEVGERIVRFGQVRVHSRHDFVGGMRAGHRQHLRVRLLDDVALGAETAGDDHLAILGQRFADRVERLLDRGIDETAGVDDDEVGIVVARGDDISLCAQLGEDAFGVDERFGTAERDETYFGRKRRHEPRCPEALKPCARSRAPCPVRSPVCRRARPRRRE